MTLCILRRELVINIVTVVVAMFRQFDNWVLQDLETHWPLEIYVVSLKVNTHI